MYKSASTSDVLGQAQSPAMPLTPLHFFMGKLETGIPNIIRPIQDPGLYIQRSVQGRADPVRTDFGDLGRFCPDF
jgi:hypothetical protein